MPNRRRVLQFPSPADGLARDCVVELPYLDAGRRVFVAVDKNGWLIASGMELSDEKVEKLLHRLHDALDAYHERERLHITP